MASLVKAHAVELDTSPVDGRLRSFSAQLQLEAEQACQAVFERTRVKAVFIDPGTTWGFQEFEGRFTLDIKVFYGAIVIQDIEVTKPHDGNLGSFVIWYDGYKHFLKVPRGSGPANRLYRFLRSAIDVRFSRILPDQARRVGPPVSTYKARAAAPKPAAISKRGTDGRDDLGLIMFDSPQNPGARLADQQS